MKTKGLESIRNEGLKVSMASFNRIKAFKEGGDYWDNQTLIRESLGEFLPPIEQIEEGGQRNGLFRKTVRDRDVLWKSSPVGKVLIPSAEIHRLSDAITAFKNKAERSETTPNAKDIINHFRLPDISKEPDLYRIYGPWWDRKLQVLWGVERIPDSSLDPVTAIAKLPIDKSYSLKRWCMMVALLCFLCALLALLWHGVPAARQWIAKRLNRPPIAVLKLDSLDEPKLVATVSDSGSYDSDGHLERWTISWGDGKTNDFSIAPTLVNHTYDTERDYTISLTCVDNYGATSAPPASVSANFDYQKRKTALAEANRAAQEILQKAKDEAEHTTEGARAAEEKAKQGEKVAEQKQVEAEEALKHAQEQAADAERKLKEERPPPSVAGISTNQVPTEAASGPNDKSGPLKSNESSVPTPTNGSPASSGDGESEASKSGPHMDNRKGAQVMKDSIYEIVKAGTGQFGKDGKLQIMLVVRDKASPNKPISVQEWQANGRSYKNGNSQLTISLPVGEYIVQALVRASGEDPRWQKAKVTVHSDLHQTNEVNFTVTNF
jgi:hypothetical protein